MVFYIYILSYTRIIKYLEIDGFKFNLYDPCIYNKIVEEETPTVVFHADDAKSIHKGGKLVDNFEQWIDLMYGDTEIGKFKSVRENFREYFSMTLDYTTRGEVKIDMRKYVKKMIGRFSLNIDKVQAVTILATDNLFNVEIINPMNKNKVEVFHTTVARGFSYKREQDRTFSPLLKFYALE